MRYTYEMIVEKLKLYPTLQEKNKLLCFELKKLARVSEDDILASLAYGSSSGEKTSSGNSNSQDRMLKVAMSYKSMAEQMNSQAVAEIVRELSEVNTEIERLEYHMSLLSPELVQIIRLFFFDRKTWYEIESETGFSRRTLTKRRTEAIERLAQMYSYTGEFISK